MDHYWRNNDDGQNGREPKRRRIIALNEADSAFLISNDSANPSHCLESQSRQAVTHDQQQIYLPHGHTGSDRSMEWMSGFIAGPTFQLSAGISVQGALYDTPFPVQHQFLTCSLPQNNLAESPLSLGMTYLQKGCVSETENASLNILNRALVSQSFPSSALMEYLNCRDDAFKTRNTSSDPNLTGRSPISLYMICDNGTLSPYQCLVRKQIEIFEACHEDVESNAQGRNRPIVMGQVGIRCRHCNILPPKLRARGATYYPSTLTGLYQAAQNMASGHFCEHCQNMPDAVKTELLKLRERKSSAGGGKKYWANGVQMLGVVESSDGLRFVRV